jgi:hypothetical protein
MPSHIPLLSLLLVLLAAGLCDAQTATCTNWTFFNTRWPNSNHAARGINRWGTVVGNTHNAGTSLYPAFVRYPTGILNTYFVPNASATFFARRNSQGVTVGWYTDNTSPIAHNHGLVVSGASMVTVDYPGASDTFLQGINRWGTIVGAYYDPGTFMEKAFVLKNGVFTHIVPPGSSPLDWNSAMSINDKGVIAGWHYDSGFSFRGFTLANGVYTMINNPKGTASGGGTQVFDINNLGVMVGRYNFDFAFIYVNGIFKDVKDPIYAIRVEGINDYGYVSGEANAFYPNSSKLFTAHCQ